MINAKKYIVKQQKRIAHMVALRFNDYYLTGGTALAFYYNHRFSEDLDFFTQKYLDNTPDQIMNFISEKTGFPYQLDAEQSRIDFVKMKVYSLKLDKGCKLKIDMVQDYTENINVIRNGLHSLNDIYYRKILATIGTTADKSKTGRLIPTGRQSSKDLFDIYYLSRKYKPISKFFLEYFSYDKAEPFFVWYHGFNRTNLKIELMDLVPNVDTMEVLNHLDNEILKKLPKKLI